MSFLNHNTTHTRNNTTTPVSRYFKKYLQWFRSFNGTTTFTNWAGTFDVEIHIDASQINLGAVGESSFYSVPLPVFLVCRNHIVVFEMLNIIVAFTVWGKLWSNKRVLLWCDKRAVVDIMGRNKTRDSELGAILRDILMVQASN